MPRTARATKNLTRRRLALLGAATLSAAAVAAPAQAGIGTHGPLTERYGFFPEYYQDAGEAPAAGPALGHGPLQLQLCLELAPTCGAVALPNPGPISFPDNFPDEMFYWSASAGVPGVSLTLAQEATFDGIDGNQAAFGRLRIRGIGLIPDEWYRFTTPYGILESQATAGAVQIKDIGSDVGCGPAIGVVCTDTTFGDVGLSAIGPNFLTWDTFPGDPALTTPTGAFVGDAVTDHAVKGSTFLPDGVTPANYFQVDRIAAPGGAVVQALGRDNTFVVQGKLADVPPQPYLIGTSGAAGNQPVTAGPKALTVTIRNGGSANLDIAGASVAANPDFVITSTDCTTTRKTLVRAGRTQAPTAANQTCTVNLAFDPSTAGAKSATLQLTEQAGALHSIALSGVGTVATLTTDETGVSFGSQVVGNTAPTQTVTVRNAGGAPLAFTASAIGGANSADFAIIASTCADATLQPNGTCTIDLHFTPVGAGVRNGTLDISGGGGGTRSVPLSGVGVAPAAAGGGGGATGAAPGGAAAGGAAAGGGATGGGVGAALPKLALKRLGSAARVKRIKATRVGLALLMDLPSGTNVVKINVYRTTRLGRRLLSSGFRSPSATGLYRVRLNSLALRRAFRRLGVYELQVTPGRSRTDLGTTSRIRVKIVR